MPPQIITALTREYQVEHPIALAPMAFVGSTPALAIAVCNAGGIGSLAAGILPVNVLFNTIQAIKDQTDRPFNVNFVSLFVQPEQIQLCIEQAVPIVSFHWGAPEPVYIQQLKDAGIKVWMQVGSVAAAQEAAALGADFIIAQGNEAGGHNYDGLPLFILLPEIVAAVAPIPVLAAGGISREIKSRLRSHWERQEFRLAPVLLHRQKPTPIKNIRDNCLKPIAWTPA